jgi:hypothetical protein
MRPALWEFWSSTRGKEPGLSRIRIAFNIRIFRLVPVLDTILVQLDRVYR